MHVAGNIPKTKFLRNVQMPLEIRSIVYTFFKTATCLTLFTVRSPKMSECSWQQRQQRRQLLQQQQQQQQQHLHADISPFA
jgi:hypothetical protein